MAFYNFYASNLGKTGVQFIHETDIVIGEALLGVPHYSKIVSVILAVNTIGILMAWSTNNAIQLIVVCCLIMQVFRQGILIFYAFFTKQNEKAVGSTFLLMSIVALTLWRANSFLDPKSYGTVVIFICICTVLLVVAGVVMKKRSASQQRVILEYIHIKQYIENNNPDWPKDSKLPVGFVSTLPLLPEKVKEDI